MYCSYGDVCREMDQCECSVWWQWANEVEACSDVLGNGGVTIRVCVVECRRGCLLLEIWDPSPKIPTVLFIGCSLLPTARIPSWETFFQL